MTWLSRGELRNNASVEIYMLEIVEWLSLEGAAADSDKGAECINVDTIACGTDKVIDGVAASGLRLLAFKNGEHTLLLQWYDKDPHPG